MNSSGRLPSVDCKTPVTAGPNLAPTCSVANETIDARAESAAPARAKARTLGAAAEWQAAAPVVARAATSTVSRWLRDSEDMPGITPLGAVRRGCDCSAREIPQGRIEPAGRFVNWPRAPA